MKAYVFGKYPESALRNNGMNLHFCTEKGRLKCEERAKAERPPSSSCWWTCHAIELPDTEVK